MEIEIRGFATVETDPRTLGDLRDLIKQVDEWGLSSDIPLDWGQGKLFIDVHPDAVQADVIFCGNHIPERKEDGTFRDGPVDFIIAVHECGWDSANQYEQPEFSFEEEVPKFDWPTKDKQQP